MSTPLLEKKYVDTESVKVAYFELGDGPVAVFIHGLGLNAYYWRYQLQQLSQYRRCIAIDLMAHGETETNDGQDVSFRVQASVILEALTQLGVDSFDLVGSDSGGAIAQIIAVTAPLRVRSMVLTNCDVHDNWPPVALSEIREAARAGILADQFEQFVDDPSLFRAAGGLASMVYENTQTATDESIDIYINPLVSSPQRKAAFNRYAGFQDHSQLVQIEEGLRRSCVPCLIVWGTDDIFFPTQWAYWLHEALPGARDVVEVPGAKLFFPEERPEELNRHVSKFWRET